MKRFALIALAMMLGACATTAVPVAAPPADPAIAAERIKPFQYLYGSGEAGAISIAAYHALVDLVRDRTAHRRADSVVLAPGSTLSNARFMPCGDKPFAVIADVDETMIQNLGFEARAAQGEEYEKVRWKRYTATGANSVLPIPGANFAVGELRKMGVTVIFNTGRDSDEAAGTAAMIEAAGLGPVVHGETLFLRGDDGMGPGKDQRRTWIADRYCVIAMAGDQLGDFSDLFNARGLPVPERRQAAIRGWAAQLWGNGWFMMPNPVYGPSLQGGIDDIFPAERRWADPAGGQ
jgi:5'-nucleotidase (lipoprotein e(P4) family)